MRSEAHLGWRRMALVLGVALCIYVGGARVVTEQQTAGSRPSSEDTPAGQAAGDSELSFTTYLDRTAVWVGDQFHYRIFVEHAPTVQFILENLSQETISLDPLRVVNVESSTMPLENGNERLSVDLTLAHFTTGVEELEIPQLSLFYFRAERGAAAVTGDGAAAESLTIPGPVIGVRSTLTGSSDLRDAVTVSSWPSARWIAAGIGWVALLLLIGGVAWEGTRVVRRRGGHEGPDPREQMAAIRDQWSRSVPADFGDADVVMEFYGRSYHALKEYLGYLLETHTAGLMADEMRAEMARLTARPDLTDRVGKVLDICENARYARNGTDLNSDAAQAVTDDMRQIFQAESPA